MATATMEAIDTNGGPTADRENEAKCRAFYGEIASELGATVAEFGQRCGQGWGCTLVDVAGRKLRISPTWQTGDRLKVRGEYPRTKLGESRETAYRDECNPDITVSIHRQPMAIAQDIARRFLPDFHARWAVVAKRVADTDEYDAKRGALKARLVDAIDGAKANDTNSHSVYAPGFYDGISTNGDNVRIEYSYIPAELAFQLIAVSEKWRREHDDD